MNKFKIGDKVKVIGTSTICSRCEVYCEYIGSIGIITYIESNGQITVKNFPEVFNTHYCSAFEENVLELAEPIKKIIKPFGIVKFLAEN